MSTTMQPSSSPSGIAIALSQHHLLQVADGYALGRAVGTLLCRLKGERVCRIGVAFVGGSAAVLRDGCVRGLILSGHQVVEVQVPPHVPAPAVAARVAGVLAQQQRADGLHMTLVASGPGLQCAVELRADGVPLTASQLDGLAEIVAEGPFAAGLGTLTVLDHEAPHTGAL